MNELIEAAIYTELAILCGLALDLVIGDPVALMKIHPVVLMGKCISFLEKRLRAVFPKTNKGELAAGALMAWIMRSVDAIPVYYQEPAKLRQTFRQSISAMEAGDNILLFPENSDDTPDHHYKTSGVSHFFTGFTMLAPMYYKKTGKRAIFVPIYADKKKRVLTFGAPIQYDPENDPEDEKNRLCDHLRGEMLKIAGEEETDEVQ